ncbi:probable G-protein coupled receptor 148 [Bufo bufo]|uniref:probable G-protein coupled receptor 148 n=1 Tax=Bufo bufo TaxID=8384 RepID=UPI001ABDF948|nr:probable G-protein coupled receptor 148 [Bufo bufo]
MLIDYINYTPYFSNPLSLTTNGSFNSNTTGDSQGIPESASLLWTFLIPAAIFSIVTLLANPMILVSILLKDTLRNETRYILLANVMVSDLIFILFNSIISMSNAIRWYMHRVLCFSLISFTVAAYSSCVLTFTIMVVDTYVAICFPLHYYSILSMKRTRKILLAIWIFSALFPLIVSLASETFDYNLLEKQNVCLMLYYGSDERNNILVTVVCALTICFLMFCSVMITYFYIKLYAITRKSGIWVSRFSRARITLLTHFILLGLYIVPAFILTAEVMLFKNSVIGIDTRIWMSACNNGLVMMMPRALSPLLYGLRYREIYATLKHWFSRNRVSSDSYR